MPLTAAAGPAAPDVPGQSADPAVDGPTDVTRKHGVPEGAA